MGNGGVVDELATASPGQDSLDRCTAAAEPNVGCRACTLAVFHTRSETCNTACPMTGSGQDEPSSYCDTVSGAIQWQPPGSMQSRGTDCWRGVLNLMLGAAHGHRALMSAEGGLGRGTYEWHWPD